MCFSVLVGLQKQHAANPLLLSFAQPSAFFAVKIWSFQAHRAGILVEKSGRH